MLLLLLLLLLNLASGDSNLNDLQTSDSDFQTKTLFDAVESDDADGVRAVAAGARINDLVRTALHSATLQQLDVTNCGLTDEAAEALLHLM